MSYISSLEIPKDFWDPVMQHDPKILGESLLNNRQIGKLFDNFNFIDKSLLILLKKGEIIGTRGNGYCGIYSILASIIKKNKKIYDMDHSLFLEQITPIMEIYGIYDRPLAIDADLLCNIMRVYFETYLSDIQNPSFAIFSLSDQTIKFDAPKDSRCFMNNLFTIIYDYGHFESLCCNEKDIQKIYLKLQKFVENS